MHVLTAFPHIFIPGKECGVLAIVNGKLVDDVLKLLDLQEK